MQRKNIIAIIGLVLLIFACVSITFSQLCKPSQDNVVLGVVSNTLSAPQLAKNSTHPDPLSWDPILHQLILFFSKACPA